MKTIAILLLTSIISSSSNFNNFKNLIKQNKYSEAKVVLDNWGDSKENDPQYYISCFNYYIIQSQKSGMVLQTEKPYSGDSFEFTDPSSGETKGYMANRTYYEGENYNKAIDYIKEGINKFPDHYEMRFGLLWIHQENRNFKQFLVELEDALKFYYLNKPKRVYWNDNKIINSPYDFIIENAQGNISYFYNNLEIQKNISFLNACNDLLIKYYPDHKYGYNNKGILSYISKDFNNALKYYSVAYSKDQNDAMILLNIAYTYKNMNNIEQSKKYFNDVIKLDRSGEYKKIAKRELKELK